jgi:hypothetical protein
MSLWTPDGERPIERDTPDDLTPDDQARAEALAAEMAQVRQQLLSVPAAMVVANHAMGLYELAAIHLGNQPPNLPEAQVAIDAYAALVESVGDRLGEDAATLRDALAQIRLAYVQIHAGSTDAAGAADDAAGPA